MTIALFAGLQLEHTPLAIIGNISHDHIKTTRLLVLFSVVDLALSSASHCPCYSVLGSFAPSAHSIFVEK